MKTTDLSENCENCHHFDDDEGQCRARAPIQFGRMDFYFGELLRSIALAQMELSTLSFNPKDRGDILNVEATEAYQRDLWPSVKPTDWCGEFSPHLVDNK